MDGPAFRRSLLQAAGGRADQETLAALRVELRERFETASSTPPTDEHAPQICPACKEAIDEPTLPQHISTGCPALK
jgi:hypothetical protein